jgi:hypothetical protein
MGQTKGNQRPLTPRRGYSRASLSSALAPRSRERPPAAASDLTRSASRCQRQTPLIASRRRRASILLLVGVLCLLSMTAAASRTFGEDRRSAATPSIRFADDARLDQNVSVTAWAEPLEDLLAQLSRKTDVQLLFEGRDVGDQRVHVILNDQPLRRVQTLLAEDLDLYWRRERKGAAYRYVLFQDLRSRKEEAELRARARGRFEQGVRRLVDSLQLTPEQIEKLRGQSAGWARRLTDPGRRRAVELLSRLGPSRWDRLMETGRVEMPFESLSPADQELVRQYVAVSNEQRDREDEARGTPGKSHIGDVAATGGKVAIVVFGGVPAGPDSTLDFNITPADGKGGGHGLGLGFTVDEQRALREAFTPAGFDKKKRNPPADGGPRVTITWKKKPERWEEVLRSVAEAAGLEVVSDSFLYQWWEENMDLPDAVALTGRPLEEVLDRVSAPFFYAWRREGEVYLFRNRDWFLEKTHNVSERDLRRWRELVRTTGRVGLEILVDLAPLSRRQLRNVSNAGIPTGSVVAHQAVLRLYAALSPLQRERLQTLALPVRELSASQIEWLRAWKSAAVATGETQLRVRRERDSVVFSLNTDGVPSLEERVLLERSAPDIRQ